MHKEILEDAMYVNTSDYEGISNAMLESMAIGLPVICTDCPIGGARQTIRDHENGILVPSQDVKALSNAMNEVIENPFLCSFLSKNSTSLRDKLNVVDTSNLWLKLL